MSKLYHTTDSFQTLKHFIIEADVPPSGYTVGLCAESAAKLNVSCSHYYKSDIYKILRVLYVNDKLSRWPLGAVDLQGGPKKVNPKCSTHNFVKYWPIFISALA